MEQVIIRVDPHKSSATIEVVDDRERLLGSGRFTTDRAGYAAMRRPSQARGSGPPVRRRSQPQDRRP
jgi:transposase